MILDYSHLSHGHKPQRYLGLGFIARRSGTDADEVITFVPPKFTISRRFVQTANIERKHVHTANIERINVGINEQ